MDSDAFTGEVIFTFDGDAAGMKAAERAFGDDQKFMAQTFVAIEPNGMDPCELRQKSGDTAVLDLVARRIPLVEFVLRTTVGRLRPGHRRGAHRPRWTAAVPLVARIKDHALRDEYARRLAGLVGCGRPDRGGRGGARAGTGAGGNARRRPAAAQPPRPTPAGRRGGGRSSARCSRSRCSCPRSPARSSTRSPRRRSWSPRTGSAAGGRSRPAGAPARGRSGPAWPAQVARSCPTSGCAAGCNALAVEPLRAGADGAGALRRAVLARTARDRHRPAGRALKSKLQRINPLEQPDEHARLFGELISLEGHRRVLARSGDRRRSDGAVRPAASARRARWSRRSDADERLLSWADTATGAVVAATSARACDGRPPTARS